MSIDTQMRNEFAESDARRIEKLEKKLAVARAALKAAVDWMGPIMDGFRVPNKQADGSPSSRVEVLEKAKRALREIGEKE